jgi:mycoredoxin
MALTVYSTTWCGPCKRLKSQLSREGIVYNEVDIEKHPDAAAFVMSVNNGNQTVPTVVFDSPSGRRVRTNPSVAEVKRMLEEVA